MSLRQVVLGGALIAALTACGGSDAPTSSPPAEATLTPAGATSPPVQPTPTPATPSLSPGPSLPSPAVPSPAGLMIAVMLTDALRIEPAEMIVSVGQRVTFVVTNTGALDHEFYLGDEAAQAEHAAEMAEMGGLMPHDEENGIGLEPGETKELTYTFPSASQWIAGCHITGHYAGGMKATVTITP